VSYHDPYVAEWIAAPVAVTPVADLHQAVASADLVILMQNHRGYDADALARAAKRFFDTRGVTTVEESHRL
jgi:UDP-N-acetyl-D-mannosaminuronate dehydrogenase